MPGTKYISCVIWFNSRGNLVRQVLGFSDSGLPVSLHTLTPLKSSVSDDVSLVGGRFPW